MEEEEEPRVTNFNIPVKEIEKRFRALLKLIDVLVVKVKECTQGTNFPTFNDIIR